MCTDEDFAKFYPIEGYQESVLEDIKKDPERGFFCIDEDEDLELELYGRENYENYQRLELIMLPCNSINSDLGLMQGDNGIVSPECVPDLEA